MRKSENMPRFRAPNKSWLTFCCGSSPLSAHFRFAYLPTVVNDGIALQSTSCLQITKAKAASWLGDLTHNNLIDIYRTLHPTTARHAFFSSAYAYGAFIKIELIEL